MPAIIVNYVNPFATRFISPGRIEFVQASSELAVGERSRNFVQRLAQDFSESNFVGQVVGPHGCGKSALAIEISRRLERSFDFVRSVVVRRNGAFGLTIQQEIDGGNGRGLILMDGIENLTAFNRACLLHSCFRNGTGLLVTCHRRLAGLKLLVRLSPSVDVFQNIVAALTSDAEFQFDRKIVATVFEQSQRNYREGLMKMYDLFRDCAEGLGANRSCQEKAGPTGSI